LPSGIGMELSSHPWSESHNLFSCFDLSQPVSELQIQSCTVPENGTLISEPGGQPNHYGVHLHVLGFFLDSRSPLPQGDIGIPLRNSEQGEVERDEENGTGPGMDTGAGMWNAGGPGRSPCTTFIPGALAEAISFQTLLLSANPVTRISVHSANDLLT